MNSDLLWRKVLAGNNRDLLRTFKLCAGLPQHPKPFFRFQQSPFSIILIWEISWTKEILKQSAICGSIYYLLFWYQRHHEAKRIWNALKQLSGQLLWDRTGHGRNAAVWPNAWRGSPLDVTASVSSGAFYLARKKVCSDSLSSYGKSQETQTLIHTSVTLCPAWDKRIDVLAVSFRAG